MHSQPETTNPKLEAVYRPWLHGFAVAFVVLTFCLLVLGGTVTSKGVGLSVPDWPTTFQYNMFLFPPSMWHGGVFYEHTHRLLGAVVGLLSIVMAVGLWRTQGRRPWLQKLGVLTLGMVILQGVMGGLRVTQLSVVLAIFHGVTAQLFLCMTVAIAAATSRWWAEKEKSGTDAANGTDRTGADAGRGLRYLSVAFAVVVLVQLVLGATMRHTGSGLAIPDFPSSYGQPLPPLNQADLNRAIDGIPYDEFTAYYRVWQVAVHFAHRVGAVAVAATALWLAARIGQRCEGQPALRRPAAAIVGLIALQILLGASVIWSGRHPELATAHQALGAAILAMAALLALRLHRVGGVPAALPGRWAGRSGSSDRPPHVHAPRNEVGTPPQIRPAPWQGARA